MPVGPPDLQGRLPKPFDPFRLISNNRHGWCYNPFMLILFPEFRRSFLKLRGPDRVKFLHNLVTHDIKGLQTGQARPACLLDRQGKIQAFFLAHAGPDELILEMDPIHFSATQITLNRFLISEAVEIRDCTKEQEVIPLHGPQAADLLKSVWPGIPLPENPLRYAFSAPETGLLRIVRWDLFRQPGYHLWVAPENKEKILQRITAEGKTFGLETGVPETFHILRIEAGVPWPGAEITDTVILNELGTEEFVSFTKGCYIGQEIVARIKYRAHPPRQLAGFFLDSPEPPRAPCPILLESKNVGVMTSTCFSPTLKRTLGLGFLNFGLQELDFEVTMPSSRIKITKTDLPFHPSTSSG